MPNIKSAIKRVKVNEANRAQNITVKSSMRTAVKKAEAAITNNDSEAKAALTAAVSKIDKAVSKGILHKNTAARKKSRLMKKLNASG